MGGRKSWVSNMASLKGHLWGSVDVRFSLPLPREENGGSEHVVEPGRERDPFCPFPAGSKVVAPQNWEGLSEAAAGLCSTLVRAQEQGPAGRCEVSGA